MRRFLLASVATAGLTLAALPALAQSQVPNPVPATPPITTPAPDAEVTAEEQLGTAVQSPDAAATMTGDGAAAAQTSPSGVTAQTGVTGEAQAEAQTPAVAPPTQTAQETLAGTPQTAQPTTPPTATAQADAAIATPASASDVCAMRTTSVHFGARGSALSRENGNAIEHAADAASVCNLQTVAIIDSAQGRTHSRRVSAIRAALVRQGVPEDRITVEEASADAEAGSTGRVDVRMNFAGVANGSTVVADATPATGVNAAANPTLRTTMTPVPGAAPATPAPTPEAAPVPAPEATPPATPAMPEPQDEEPATTPGT